MIPPKNALIWLLIIFPIVYLAVYDMKFFDPNITISELIAYTITLGATIYGLWKFGSYLLYCRHPFTMVYQEELQYKDKLTTSDRKTIQIGTSELILRIHPKRPQEFDKIHIRLVNERKWLKVKFPTRNDIAITALNAEDLLGNDKLNTREDYTNGLQGKYEPLFHRTPDESLILTVAISAKNEWNGFIVFRTKHKYNRQYCIYLPLRIENKKV